MSFLRPMAYIPVQRIVGILRRLRRQHDMNITALIVLDAGEVCLSELVVQEDCPWYMLEFVLWFKVRQKFVGKQVELPSSTPRPIANRVNEPAFNASKHGMKLVQVGPSMPMRRQRLLACKG